MKTEKKTVEISKNNKFTINPIKQRKFKIGFIVLLVFFSIFTFKGDIIVEEKNILSPYKKKLEDFCNNPDKYIDNEIENDIRLFDVNINNISYQMYSTKKIFGLSGSLTDTKSFETKESLNILEALRFYRNKLKIKNNKDIYMLDIGGSAGWYPSFLGRYGYTILSFEPFPRNYYISSKNYCLLNKNSNVVMINKGLGLEEKICSYYRDRDSALNGMILCDIDNSNRNFLMGGRFFKKGEVILTRLSNFLPFLSDKNVALIKLDVEGFEERAIKSGIELITKYHVPFVFLEFSPKFLKEHNSNPEHFIRFFLDNGYVISLNGFLDKNYISLEELLVKVGFQINIYLIYQKYINN